MSTLYFIQLCFIIALSSIAIVQLIMFASIMIGFVVFSVYYLWDTYTYWRRKGIPGPIPLPIVGNYSTVILCQEKEADLLHRIYFDYPNEKCVGLYKGLTPVLLVKDPGFVHQMYVKDSADFFIRIFNVGHVNLEKNVAGTNDYGLWRALKTSLLPLHSSKQLAMSFPLLKRPLNKYIQYLEDALEKGSEHELNDWQKKFCFEVVGSMVLGREFGCFSKNSNIEQDIRKINQAFLKHKTFYKVSAVYPAFYENFLKPVLGFKFRKTIYFYEDLILNTNNDMKSEISCKSMLDRLYEIRGNVYQYKESSVVIDDELIVQQVFVALFVNYTTAGNTISLLLYYLADNKALQKRVRDEIDAIFERHGSDVTFDMLSETKYLDMAVAETLRLNTSNGYTSRMLVNNYTLPNTHITLKKGTTIAVSQQSLHRDPKYFPNPDVFDLDRFSEENKEKIPKGAYLAFGIGPRVCIGKSIAQFVIKLSVISFLRKFEVSPARSDKRLNPRPYQIADKIPDVWVTVTPRTDPTRGR